MSRLICIAAALLIPLTLSPFPLRAADNPLAEARSLDEQALNLYRNGAYAEAEQLLKRALAILEDALGPDHPNVATSLSNLAQLYRAQRRYGDAEPLLKQALAIEEKALGPENLDVADSLYNLAVLYGDEGLYAQAAPLYKRVLAILEKTLGPDHTGVATVLDSLAELYYRQGHYAEAEPLYERAIAIRENTLGPEHPSLVTSVVNLAGLYYQEGRFAEAEPLYERALAIREKTLGPDHPAVATSLNSLAGLCYQRGRYVEAEALYKRSLGIREKALGREHTEVGASLNNLAELYRNEGRYAEAEPLYKRALAIIEKASGPEHSDIATSLGNLAGLYDAEGRYAEAEPLYQRALAMLEKAFGSEDLRVAKSLNNLAGLYRNQARYNEAEPLYKRALTILERALGPEHPDLATSLGNLAGLYDTQARYAEAEPLQKRALNILERALGLEHPTLVTSLNNLALLYYHQGRYADAEPLYKRALAIGEKALGPEHPELAKSLNNLAGLYDARGRYPEAEPLYKRAIAIREKAFGPEHVLAAKNLGNLALLYGNEGRYGEAEAMDKRALAILEKVLGPQNPAAAPGLHNLALLYYGQGRYGEAEPLYKRALAIWEEALGPEHPNVAKGLDSLAGLYRDQGHYADALAVSRRSIKILSSRAFDLGERRTEDGALRHSRRDYFIRNVGLVHLAKEPNAAAESFKVAQLAEVSSAGAAVAAATARLVAGAGEKTVAIRERQDLARQWQALDSAIVKAMSTPPNQRNAEAERELRGSLDETGKKLEALDGRIAKEFPEYAELSNPKPLSAEAAQALLAPDEALLVYLSADDATWLWVVRRDKIAFHRIDLGAKALAHAVGALRGALDPDRNADFAPFPAQDAHVLYQKLLGPALPLLDGVKNLLVVPDGALESLPLGVLVTKAPEHDPKTPADHRDIRWLARDHAITVLPAVTSLRALRQPVKSAEAPDPFLGIGDPVLDGKPGSERGVQLASLFRGALANVDDVRKLEALPETADELRAIAKTLGAGDKDLLLGEKASEPMLRQTPLDHYRVIQFATHGLVSGDLPGLAEPALVLTPPKEATPDNDGLLTASKVATLKLNADWVVLSACNTASGDGTPDAGGLSGLAKAFFYAGARSLLVSHWKVPSEATVKLMTDAFAELKKDPKIGRAEALRRAEMAMLDPTNPPEFAHPLAWAPFVLAGEGGAGR